MSWTTLYVGLHWVLTIPHTSDHAEGATDYAEVRPWAVLLTQLPRCYLLVAVAAAIEPNMLGHGQGFVCLLWWLNWTRAMYCILLACCASWLS